MFISDGPKTPSFPLRVIHPHGPLFRHLPLSLRRHILHLRSRGNWGNFRFPRTQSEKMQWRVINDRRPVISISCDKLASRDYVRDIAAALNLNVRFPAVYWVGTDVRELQKLASKLPHRWVLKPNHSSGRYALIDSSQGPVDWGNLVEHGDRWVRRDEEELGLGHWAYGQARHLLIAEERVGQGESVLSVKVLTTDGIPRWYNVGIGNGSEKRRWRHSADFALVRREHAAINLSDAESPLHQLGESSRTQLVKIATAFTREFDHQRCDLYLDDGEFWFCEFSTYAQGGIGKAIPERDEVVALTWQLPLNPRDQTHRERFAAYLSQKPKGTLA